MYRIPPIFWPQQKNLLTRVAFAAKAKPPKSSNKIDPAAPAHQETVGCLTRFLAPRRASDGEIVAAISAQCLAVGPYDPKTHPAVDQTLRVHLPGYLDHCLQTVRGLYQHARDYATRHANATLASGGQKIPPFAEVDVQFLRNATHVLPSAKHSGSPQLAHAFAADFKLPTLKEIEALTGTLNYEVPRVTPRDQLKPYRHPCPDLDTNHAELASLLKQRTPQPSGFLLDYDVDWNRFKIIRDMQQNPYDGHGGTLEYNRYRVTRKRKEDPYTVTITGEGEFPYFHALLLGATSKGNTQESAGVFGEATKVLPLLLWRKKLAEGDIEYASRNWRLILCPRKNQYGDMEMHFRLRSQKPIPGNRFTFKTRDPRFIYQLLQGVLFFKHPQHPDFINPSYVKPGVGGFRILEPGETGRVYINGQRFQITDPNTGKTSARDGLPELTAWVDVRPKEISRDRVGLSHADIQDKVLVPVVQAMDNQDIVDFIFALQQHWEVKPEDVSSGSSKKKKADADQEELSENSLDPLYVGHSSLLLQVLAKEARRRNLVTKFPENRIALDTLVGITPARLEALKAAGRKPCYPVFKALGMRTSRKTDFLNHIESVSPELADLMRFFILREVSYATAESTVKNSLNKRAYSCYLEALKELPRFFGRRPTTPAGEQIPAVFFHPETKHVYWDINVFRKIPLREAVSSHLLATLQAALDTPPEILTVSRSKLAAYATASFKNAEGLHNAGLLWEDLRGPHQPPVFLAPLKKGEMPVPRGSHDRQNAQDLLMMMMERSVQDDIRNDPNLTPEEKAALLASFEADEDPFE